MELSAIMLQLEVREKELIKYVPPGTRAWGSMPAGGSNTALSFESVLADLREWLRVENPSR